MEGQTVSHYRVLERLGGGGMGVVYRALDVRLNRHVALKFLPPELTRDEEARARFVREAQAASALDHPNICTIYEVDVSEEGTMFIAMALYEGETLKKRISRGPLPIDEALEIARQVARALVKAHAQDIVHRDIKPANLVLTNDGLVKVLDFGIAKLLGASGPTRTGSTLGTVGYMSPEQLAGDEVDAQTDVWALGAVLYEMLAGQRAFGGDNEWAVMAAIAEREPQPVSSLRTSVPRPVEALVIRALQKDKDKRLDSAATFLGDLERGSEAVETTAPFRQSNGPNWRRMGSPAIAVPTLVAVALAATWGISAVRGLADARYARGTLIPEIVSLAGSDRYGEAYELAEEAERHIPDDPLLADLWTTMAGWQSFDSNPSGANVYYRPYDEPGSEWIHLGQTPLEDARLPRAPIVLRVELDGFDPLIYATVPDPTWRNPLLDTMELTPADDRSQRLTRVPRLERALIELNGLPTHRRELIPAFRIGTYEVRNDEYREFVLAGGYESPQYWQHPFILDGDTIGFEDAMALLRDSSGRPGPATWVGGTYPPGEDEHPVSGVSWYEAAAYAAFAGASLPTAYHWAAAGPPWLASQMIPQSNFGGEGPVPVGRFSGLSEFGLYDMAGNIKEWVLNTVGDSVQQRYILGGSYEDAGQTYKFYEIDTRSVFDRSPDNGFRIAQYEDIGDLGQLLAPIEPVRHDYRTDVPVGAAAFEALRSQYDYDDTPLEASLLSEVSDSLGLWTRQTVQIAAGYGDESLVLHTFLPDGVDGVQPPYQTVVHFPGSGATSLASVDDYFSGVYDYVITSGRAVVIPVYDGTFERRHERSLTFADSTAFYRDWMVRIVKDAHRAVDYLTSRPETFDPDHLAYHGHSWGGQMGPLILATDDRYRAAVFVVGGLWNRRPRPEVDPFNFAPRVSIPVLMINGTEDAVFPLETSQVPLFETLSLGSGSSRHHRIQATHGGVLSNHRSELMSEALGWLDTYLGRAG